jgi:site-specific DNA-cytosine methylase
LDVAERKKTRKKSLMTSCQRQCNRLPLRYLSLFSGIGGFELGLQCVFPLSTCLGFSEIDPHCISIYQYWFPNHPCLGDIRKVNFASFRGKVDLVVAGFPCQDLSIIKAGTRSGLFGDRSILFFELLRCLKECNPRFFLIENVASMPKEAKEIISQCLGVDPILLNSAPFTAQRRARLFWCNFPLSLTIPKPITCFSRQLDALHQVSHLMHSPQFVRYLLAPVGQAGKPRFLEYGLVHHSDSMTSKCIPRRVPNFNVLIDKRFDPPVFRKLSIAEISRLQGFPLNWTGQNKVSLTQQYQALGNAVTVPVIEFLMRNLCVYLQRKANKCKERKNGEKR